MALTFARATRRASRLRLALMGPPGAGKTYSALQIASGLGGRIALVDTEHGSAAKYADVATFDLLELTDHAPRQYIAAIQAAEAAGYDVLIIDSLSHAWAGRGGALEMHDRATARSKSGNSYTAWAEVTPHHMALVDAILAARCHIIATLRTKTEYLQETSNGRTEIRKVGLAPIQREGMEYEFDVIGDLDTRHRMAISKSRIATLADQVIDRPGADLGRQLRDWLAGDEGEPAAAEPTPVLAAAEPRADAADLARFATEYQRARSAVSTETLNALVLAAVAGRPRTEWSPADAQAAIAVCQHADIATALQAADAAPQTAEAVAEAVRDAASAVATGGRRRGRRSGHPLADGVMGDGADLALDRELGSDWGSAAESDAWGGDADGDWGGDA